MIAAPVQFRFLTYLAGPYSHSDPEVRVARYEHLTRAAAWLTREYSWNVFSPITHSHPLHIIGGLRGDWNYWQKIDTEFIQLSARLVVLTLPGWRDSTGVNCEVPLALNMGLPVYYLNEGGPDGYYISAEPEPEQTDLLQYVHGS